jgi:5-methylthioadenosine/S-adenosylhomocysteine deaminase
MALLLVEGGTVVTIDPRRRVIKEGALLIDGERIKAVGKAAELKAGYPGADILDARGKLIMPGLIDTHIHLSQMMARGLTDDIDGKMVRWSWDRVYPWEARLTEEDVYASARLCCLEMIRTGTTTFADPGGRYMDAVAAAVKESGLRGIIAVASMDQSPADWPLPEGLAPTTTKEALAESSRLMDRWHKAASDRIRVWASLRVEPNISEELIRGIGKLAVERGVGVQIHAWVSQARVEWVRKKTRYTPLAYYHHLGVLGDNWLATHLGWITEEEVDIMAKLKVKACHVPGAALHGANGAISVGKFPELLAAGVCITLGTDSSAASNSLDMFQAMYLAATVHKEARLDGTLITPEQALEMATINAARALLWEDELGSLEEGKKADLIIVRNSRSNWVPVYDFSLVPTLVYSGEGADVETVIVDGKIIMAGGVVKTLTEEEVLKESQQRAQRLVASLPYKIKPRWRFD